MLYFFGFFLLFCFVMILPAMVDAVAQLPPGGEVTRAEKEQGARVAQAALAGKIPWALVAATLTTGLGVYLKVLPGIPRN